jgi:hypothetical protein
VAPEKGASPRACRGRPEPSCARSGVASTSKRSDPHEAGRDTTTHNHVLKGQVVQVHGSSLSGAQEPPRAALVRPSLPPSRATTLRRLSLERSRCVSRPPTGLAGRDCCGGLKPSTDRRRPRVRPGPRWDCIRFMSVPFRRHDRDGCIMRENGLASQATGPFRAGSAAAPTAAGRVGSASGADQADRLAPLAPGWPARPVPNENPPSPLTATTRPGPT